MNSEIAPQAGKIGASASGPPAGYRASGMQKTSGQHPDHTSPSGDHCFLGWTWCSSEYFRRIIIDIKQVSRLKNRQKVMKSKVKDIDENMRDISSTVTGYKVMTTSLIIGFAAAMLFISVQFLAIYVKLTDVQSKVAVIPTLQADITQLQSDMTLVKEKLGI